MIHKKRILLVISGGIAAYKSLELIRLLRQNGAQVRCILTQGGAQFITPLSVAALSEETVYTDLWSLKDETEMGHIRLSREADLIVVAPASANMMARMAHGLADDLASTCLLAANTPIMICPAMNQIMWTNAATQENLKTLKERGVSQCGPTAGEMACGETGLGRMSEPTEILEAITTHFTQDKPLTGRTAIVTAGPTYEPLDPVRFIGNRSSGKQGFEIAKALADQGASVKLILGPSSLKTESYIQTLRVETAQDMFKTCEDNLPCDIAVCAAAVSDWRSASAAKQKLKKDQGGPPSFDLVENPDILKALSTHAQRPELVIGFAAETENTENNARDKLNRKNCDWMVVNDVSNGQVFGDDHTQITLITQNHTHPFPRQTKEEVARALVQAMINYLSDNNTTSELRAAE